MASAGGRPRSRARSGRALFALPLGVHAGVEDDVMAGQGQGVAICPDFDMAREV